MEFEFLLFEGFSNMVLSCAMEPLRDVKLREGRSRANWCISTLDGGPVSSSSGVSVMPDRRFASSHVGKRLVLIAGYGVRDIGSREFLSEIRAVSRSCEMLIAMDSAPWLLAKAGVLEGRRATIHWQELDDFRETFPLVEVTTEPFVQSGVIYTCGGASTALDLILSILREMFGKATAMNASHMFIFDLERAAEAFSDYPRLKQSRSALLQAAAQVIAENLETPLTSQQIARELGISARTLNRVFLRDLQITPGRFALTYRLRQAEYFAQHTDLPLSQIALRCGYSSSPSLCRAYRQVFGASLRQSVAK